ncbi:hypothetical protein QJS04_geneDACA013585 [Acorus gramineus]|uniref:Uncharacterized protein n=1 Tax=Acorus gramineus TaxID=55184 RepID=A0AAV9AH22_ACOGR|nr:hypothetical protein QJS04_geneDACA013585 [Acorus gramineus]
MEVRQRAQKRYCLRCMDESAATQKYQPYNHVLHGQQGEFFLSKPDLFLEKVFEDQSRGIICYRDESGEMICEGYDEGPRFHQTAAPASEYHQREIWILDQLQQRRIRVVESVDHHCIKNGVAVPDHHD